MNLHIQHWIVLKKGRRVLANMLLGVLQNKKVLVLTFYPIFFFFFSFFISFQVCSCEPVDQQPARSNFMHRSTILLRRSSTIPKILRSEVVHPAHIDV